MELCVLFFFFVIVLIWVSDHTIFIFFNVSFRENLSHPKETKESQWRICVQYHLIPDLVLLCKNIKNLVFKIRMLGIITPYVITDHHPWS